MPDPPIPDDGITDEGERTHIDPLSGVPLPPQNEREEELIGEAVDRNIRRTQDDVLGPIDSLDYDDRHQQFVEEDVNVGMLDQDISTGKSGAAAFAAATVLVAAVGVGVWAANNGADDSTGAEAATTAVESVTSTTDSPEATTAGAAVDPSSVLVLGERLVIYAKNTIGQRSWNTGFDSYMAATLVLDTQEPDDEHPRYLFESGRIMFTDVDQVAVGTGCVYSGGGSFVAISPTDLLVQGNVGVLQFDLTSDPPTYEAQFLVQGLDRQVTFSCPESTTSTNYGDPLWWVDTSRSEDPFLKTDSNGNEAVFDGFIGGDDGYTDVVWIIFPCQPDLCDSHLDVLSDEKMAEIIDQAIADAVAEGL